MTNNLGLCYIGKQAGKSVKNMSVRGVKFEYIPRKKYETDKKNNDEEIKYDGDIDFDTEEKNAIACASFLGYENKEVFIAEFEKGRGKFVGVVVGTDGSVYRILCSRFIIIPIILAAAILGIILLLLLGGKDVLPDLIDIFDNDTPIGDVIFDPIDIDDDAIDWSGEYVTSGEVQEASTEQIAIPGYGNLVISEKQQVVRLINPTGNTVIITYSIMDGDKEIFATKGILPGKENTEMNLYELLDAGDYNLMFHIRTYDIETYEPCNGADMNVAVKVKK